MTITPTPNTRLHAVPANPVRALVSPYTWLATIHLVLDLPMAIIGFTVTITGLALSFSLAVVLLLGAPAYVVTVWSVRLLAIIERARTRLLLGTDVPPAPMPARDGVLRYVGALLRSGSVWRQFAYFILQLPVACVTCTLAIAAWTLPLVFLPSPAYLGSLPNHRLHVGSLAIDNTGMAVVATVAALLFLLLVTPVVVTGLARLDAWLVAALLGPSQSSRLAARVGVLESSRREVVDAAEAERRRIERDLHDGAQQRLTALAMTLGRAKMRAGDDDAVRGLIDEAHREAKEAIVELRNLTRGIAPPVLTDRGLDAALSALAARSPVPVEVEVDPGLRNRPSPTVEAIAYFVVSEALTNVAKHARARRASVVVRRLDGHLRLVVTDDGVGGADAEHGTGLAGLAARVSAVDGLLSVTSPPGGPTVLTVELPWQ